MTQCNFICRDGEKCSRSVKTYEKSGKVCFGSYCDIHQNIIFNSIGSNLKPIKTQHTNKKRIIEESNIEEEKEQNEKSVEIVTIQKKIDEIDILLDKLKLHETKSEILKKVEKQNIKEAKSKFYHEKKKDHDFVVEMEKIYEKEDNRPSRFIPFYLKKQTDQLFDSLSAEEKNKYLEL